MFVIQRFVLQAIEQVGAQQLLQPQVPVDRGVAVPIADLRLLEVPKQYRQQRVEAIGQARGLDQIALSSFEARLDGEKAPRRVQAKAVVTCWGEVQWFSRKQGLQHNIHQRLRVPDTIRLQGHQV
ncbi:hypothetical protein D9M71_251690 [compost metagenome]